MTNKTERMKLRIIAGSRTDQVILVDPDTMVGYGGPAHIKLDLSWDGRTPHPRATLKLKTLHAGSVGFQEIPLLAVDLILDGLSKERFESLQFVQYPCPKQETITEPGAEVVPADEPGSGPDTEVSRNPEEIHTAVISDPRLNEHLQGEGVMDGKIAASQDSTIAIAEVVASESTPAPVVVELVAVEPVVVAEPVAVEPAAEVVSPEPPSAI